MSPATGSAASSSRSPSSATSSVPVSWPQSSISSPDWGEARMPVSLADGGIETALTERLHQELPEFAAFVLLDAASGRQPRRDYYVPSMKQPARAGLPLVLDTPTWRANPDWIEQLGYPLGELA